MELDCGISSEREESDEENSDLDSQMDKSPLNVQIKARKAFEDDIDYDLERIRQTKNKQLKFEE